MKYIVKLFIVIMAAYFAVVVIRRGICWNDYEAPRRQYDNQTGSRPKIRAIHGTVGAGQRKYLVFNGTNGRRLSA